MRIIFKRTSYACPEQYDAVDENGTIIAYLRLRGGCFAVYCPNSRGDMVYATHPKGDGLFKKSERYFYLAMAKLKIGKYYKNHPLPNPRNETIEELLEGME